MHGDMLGDYRCEPGGAKQWLLQFLSMREEKEGQKGSLKHGTCNVPAMRSVLDLRVFKAQTSNRLNINFSGQLSLRLSLGKDEVSGGRIAKANF